MLDEVRENLLKTDVGGGVIAHKIVSEDNTVYFLQKMEDQTDRRLTNNTSRADSSAKSKCSVTQAMICHMDLDNTTPIVNPFLDELHSPKPLKYEPANFDKIASKRTIHEKALLELRLRRSIASQCLTDLPHLSIRKKEDDRSNDGSDSSLSFESEQELPDHDSQVVEGAARSQESSNQLEPHPAPTISLVTPRTCFEESTSAILLQTEPKTPAIPSEVSFNDQPEKYNSQRNVVAEPSDDVSLEVPTLSNGSNDKYTRKDVTQDESAREEERCSNESQVSDTSAANNAAMGTQHMQEVLNNSNSSEGSDEDNLIDIPIVETQLPMAVRGSVSPPLLRESLIPYQSSDNVVGGDTGEIPALDVIYQMSEVNDEIDKSFSPPSEVEMASGASSITSGSVAEVARGVLVEKEVQLSESTRQAASAPTGISPEMEVAPGIMASSITSKSASEVAREVLVEEEAQLSASARRAASASAGISPEMIADVQELLRLFGLPYVRTLDPFLPIVWVQSLSP